MALSDNMRGALYMLGVTASFTLGDTLIKAATSELPLFQIVFLRGLLATLFMAMLAWRAGALRPNLTRRDTRLISLRSIAEALAMIPFFIALANMPIANAAAILQALPLTVTLAGAVFLGEPVGWRRLTAIVIGFGGVLMIIQPGGSDFNAYSLLVVITVALVTVRDLAVRRIARTVPALFVATAMAAAVTLGAGMITWFHPWQPVLAHQWPLILGAGACIIAGYLFSVSSMRWGELWFVTPFRYSALIWALVLGWFVFGDWPNALTLIGAVIVIATGIFTFAREQRVARLAAAR